MKTIQKKVMLMLICIANLLINPSITNALCLKPDITVLPASGCQCDNFGDPEGGLWDTILGILLTNGSCYGEQHDAIPYNGIGGLREAVTGEPGYTSVTYTEQWIGTKYPCVPQTNTPLLVLCDIAGIACGVVCGGTLGPGCICVPGVLAGCRYCVWTDCVGDTNNPLPIYGLKLSSVEGCCTG